MQNVNQTTCFKLNKCRNAMALAENKGQGLGAEDRELYSRAGGRGPDKSNSHIMGTFEMLP